MAQANRQLQGCIVAKTISGNSPQILELPEGRLAARQWQTTELCAGVAADTGTATGSPNAGAMVYINSTGALECWPGAMVATGYDTIQYTLAGLLLENTIESTGAASNSALTNRVHVAIANNDTIFETAIVSQTATTTATTSASLIGMRMSASANGSRFYLDRTTDAPTRVGSELFKVVDVVDAEGTLNGRIQFMPRRGVFINDAAQI